MIKAFMVSLLLLPFFHQRAVGQTRVADSLYKLIHQTNDHQKKLDAILNFCEQFQSLNRDTIYNYALLAVRMSRQTHDNRQIARSQLAFANSYYVWGWVDSTLAVTEQALANLDVVHAETRDVYFKLVRQKGLCYGAISRFAEGLDILYPLIEEAKRYGDSITLASTYNTIGSFKIGMNEQQEAISLIRKGKAYISPHRHFDLVRANMYTNLANIYSGLQQTDSAIYYLDLSIPLCRVVQNLSSLATALRLQSHVYTMLADYAKAEAALVEMQEIRRHLNGASNLVEDNIQLANFYASTGQTDRAIRLLLDNIRSGDASMLTDTSISNYTNSMRMKLKYFEPLADLYKRDGRMKDYQATLESIIAAKDSFYEANSAQAIAEMQAKYELQEKEHTILQQQYNITRKNFLFYGSLLVIVSASILFFFLFRDYRRKQKLNMERAMEEEKAASAYAVKAAEEKERKRIAADLHDNLGVQANAILYGAELLKQQQDGNADLVEDLHDTAKQMLHNLRETLWAMKTTDIPATELWLRIIGFCQQMGRHYAHIRFAVQGSPPASVSLISVKALHLLMIVQEAIQNSVKHAQCSEVLVISSYADHTWMIQVSDNGRGFDAEILSGKTDSNGLNNMQERAKSSGLLLSVDSKEGSGTRVLIRMVG